LLWAKHSRFHETRRARLSRVLFYQARTVVSGTCNHVLTTSSFAILAAFGGRSCIYEFAFFHRRAIFDKVSILHFIDLFCTREHSTVLNKFGLSDTNQPRGRQTRSNRSQNISKQNDESQLKLLKH